MAINYYCVAKADGTSPSMPTARKQDADRAMRKIKEAWPQHEWILYTLERGAVQIPLGGGKDSVTNLLTDLKRLYGEKFDFWPEAQNGKC